MSSPALFKSENDPENLFRDNKRGNQVARSAAEYDGDPKRHLAGSTGEALALGLGFGVFVGGVIGMSTSLFISSAVVGTIYISAWIAVGTAVGAFVSLMRNWIDRRHSR